MTEHLCFIADCGGTNSRMQLYSVRDSDLDTVLGRGKCAPGTLLYEHEFLNHQYTDVGRPWTDIYDDFIKRAEEATGRACTRVEAMALAVAGPVENNAVEFTNVSPTWSIDGNALAAKLGIRHVKLMNDFVANGYGLLTLNEAVDCRVLQAAPKVEGAPIACVGAGTGLGECFLTSSGGDDAYSAYPTEGGHTEFAPRNQLEFELLQYLMKKFEQQHRVSVERVISGKGLANVFEFLCQHNDFKHLVNPAVKKEFDEAGSLQGKVVGVNSANDELCARAMEIFVGAYGTEAGSCGLKYLPFGGLYLAGGLTPKNLHHIEGEHPDDEAAVAALDPETAQKDAIRETVTRVLTEPGVLCSDALSPLHKPDAPDAFSTEAADFVKPPMVRQSSVTPPGTFLRAFRDKGRLSHLLYRVPVYAVLDQSLGQRGAHYVVVKLLQRARTEAAPAEPVAASPVSEGGARSGSAGAAAWVGTTCAVGAVLFAAGVVLGRFQAAR